MSGLEAKHAVLALLGNGVTGSTSINLENAIAPMRRSPRVAVAIPRIRIGVYAVGK
ncbi:MULTISPECIES: hypothetical protein [unclassified Rhizobium]|uniref:hypothetical protein n=1 Tax=unclassified Rhizobium TaxID=2613769 RepID=UPI0013B02685|nr:MULTISPECIES: hypothetical protein [unclassified Rhizobium]QYA16306.1 hypothetical protein J5284_30560 [Rhizobium sp. AB2/73]UEQ84849.1 hypothetical protein I8E17_26860 [Rhizobium sp. AB2/73]